VNTELVEVSMEASEPKSKKEIEPIRKQGKQEARLRGRNTHH